MLSWWKVLVLGEVLSEEREVLSVGMKCCLGGGRGREVLSWGREVLSSGREMLSWGRCP